MKCCPKDKNIKKEWTNKLEGESNNISNNRVIEINNFCRVFSHPFRETITTFLEGKVGLPYPPSRLEEIYKIGKARYDRGTPPGFQDKNKDGVGRYGDLILWFQIIDQAKSIKKSIIFITDDRKEDWWLKFKGKIIGPHPELINEMLSSADVGFYMYQTEQFMEHAQKYFEWQVNPEAIDEVRDIRKIEEEIRRLDEEYNNNIVGLSLALLSAHLLFREFNLWNIMKAIDCDFHITK